MRELIFAERGKGQAEHVEDFGFNYPLDVVWRCFSALRLHGILPHAGGVMDQDPRLWDDMMVLYRIMAEEQDKVGDAPRLAPAARDAVPFEAFGNG